MSSSDPEPDPESPSESPSEATLILRRLSSGEPAAARELYPLVQAELRRLAGRAMRSILSGPRARACIG